MTFDDVRAIAALFPETVETTSYRTPSFKVGKKMLCRLREEGDVLVVPVEEGLKDALIASRPDVYFETPHYAGTTLVLVRLAAIGRDHLAEVLADAWTLVATTRMRAGHPELPDGVGDR